MICKSLIGMHLYLSYHCLILLADVEVILPNRLKEIVKGTIMISWWSSSKSCDHMHEAVQWKIWLSVMFTGRWSISKCPNDLLLATRAQCGAKNKWNYYCWCLGGIKIRRISVFGQSISFHSSPHYWVYLH